MTMHEREVTRVGQGISPTPELPTPAEPGAAAELLSAAARYRTLGWPVAVRNSQVLLSLGEEAAALIVPVALATQVMTMLATRACPAPVLVHPLIPAHRIVLAGEPFGVALPWPDEIHTVAGHLPLPPTPTTVGPLTWVHLPAGQALTSCREIDLFSVVHALMTGTYSTQRRQ